MKNYLSHKEIIEKETKLLLDLKKERKDFNEYIISGTQAEELVKEWNKSIDEFGVFTVYDLKEMILKFRILYTDIKYGWKSKINLKRDFVIDISDGIIMCKLNLPPYEELE